MYDSIENLVRSHVLFPHGVANNNWNIVYCEVCGDGSRTKGPRGGWLFNDGGASAAYHCFNCGCKESFSTLREYPFSKGMKNVLLKFGIPEKEINIVAYPLVKTKLQKTIKKEIQHTVIDFPSHFYELKTAKSGDECAKRSLEFLKKNYGLEKSDYSFYLSTGEVENGTPNEIIDAKILKDRIIIPYFKYGKLIYYQGRDITDKKQKKYYSPALPRTNVLFNIDALYVKTNSPLYITEGAFDAIHLGGVATLENDITSQQLDLLNKSTRRKVLVPDFKGDSIRQIEIAIKNGWEISIPEYRNRHKDVCESVINNGKLYTFYDIAKNIKSAKEAALLTFLFKK